MNNFFKTKYLILGAGITGLSIAHFLETNKEKNYLILEKESVIGGMIRDVIVGKDIFSTSGHFLHFRKKENIDFFSKNFPLISKNRNSGILIKNEIIPQPFQQNFRLLKNINLVKKIDNEYKIASINNDGDYENFKEMILKRYGKTMCKLFLFPYNEKLYGNLNKLSISSMGRFFPNTSYEDSLKNFGKQAGYNSIIYHPNDKRFSMILSALDFDDNKIILNCEVNKIDTKNKVVYSKNKIFKYYKLISTIPLDLFLNFSNHKKLAKKLKARTLNVFNIKVRNCGILNNYDWLYIPEKNLSFFRVGSYSNILNEDGYKRLYVECKNNTDFNEIFLDLKKIKIINDFKDILNCKKIVLKNSYNIITPDSEEIVKNYKEKDVYLAGRYGRWSYGGVEDCFEEAKVLVKKIIKDINVY